MKSAPVNIGVLVIIAALGLSRFTDGVRPVQIVGLFASGAAAGVALAMIFTAISARRKKPQQG